MKAEEKKDWSTPDEKGIIHMPDYLDPLYHKVGMQIRFHTISGKNEMETIAHIISLAEDFFKERERKAFEAARETSTLHVIGDADEQEYKYEDFETYDNIFTEKISTPSPLTN